MSAIQAGQVADQPQPAEAGAEEERPGTDTQRLVFAEWPGHNWCKMRHRRPVAFHISDKTFFRPKLPACLKPTHRTRACYSTRNQWVNMQMPPSGQRSTLIGNIGSHDDVFFVVGFCVVVGSLRRVIDDHCGAIRPRNNLAPQ